MRSAPAHCEALCRSGNDLFVVWDAEDVTTDGNLKAALEIARALCVRQRQAKEQQSIDFSIMDRSILEIEKRVGHLDQIRTSAQTIENSSKKILDQVERDRKSLDKQVEVLRECIIDLKASLATGPQVV